MKFNISVYLVLLLSISVFLLSNYQVLSKETSTFKKDDLDDDDDLFDEGKKLKKEEAKPVIAKTNKTPPTNNLPPQPTKQREEEVAAAKNQNVPEITKKERSAVVGLKGETLHQKWKRLFKVDRNVLVECSEPKIPLLITDQEFKKKDDRGALIVAPQVAPDPFTLNNLGFGASAYFFDYLDETLMQPIVNDFVNVWKEAMAITPKDDKYEDPYALATMLAGKPRRMSEIKADENTALLRKMKSIYPKFNEAVWAKSLDAFKINALLKEWNWNVPTGISNPAKWLIDEYDFNGDGRLNVREFIAASISTNKKIQGDGQCKQCYEKTMKELVDPIFHYCDCDSDNRITTDELWKGLRLLKHDEKYNFYKCVISNAFFRTSAANDFMLKGSIAKQGQMNIDEFRQAVFFGYWNRHTTIESIVKDSSLSKRDSLRWPGGKDIGCQEMERNLNEARANKKEKDAKECKMKKKIIG